MKTLRTIMLAIAFSLITLTAVAQPKQGKDQSGWHDKMRTEKIAFLTSELELTPEEAQVFWPVYNQEEKQKNVNMKALRMAYKSLHTSLSEGKSDAEIAGLLEEYNKASKAVSEADARAVKEYGKVLSPTKVARLILSEEKFRKIQFERLQNHMPNSARPADKSGK